MSDVVAVAAAAVAAPAFVVVIAVVPVTVAVTVVVAVVRVAAVVMNALVHVETHRIHYRVGELGVGGVGCCQNGGLWHVITYLPVYFGDLRLTTIVRAKLLSCLSGFRW